MTLYEQRLINNGWKLFIYRGVQCCEMNNRVCFSLSEPTKYYKNKKALETEIDTWDIDD